MVYCSCRMTNFLLFGSSLSLVFSFAVLLLCNGCFCQNLSVCENASCGTIFANMSYPFGLANSGCGHPAFQIHCVSSNPHLTINGVNYTVTDLDHNSKTITVVNDGIFSNTVCPFPQGPVNLTASPFIVAPLYNKNLTLLTGCPFVSSMFPKVVCNGDSWYAWSYIPMLWPVACTVIQVPVVVPDFPIANVLRKGFEMLWSETDEMFRNCRDCEKLKGICGFNISGSFVCYVPNSTTNGNSTDLPNIAAASPSAEPAATANPNVLSTGVRLRDKSYTRIIIGLSVGSALLVSAASMAVFLCYKKDPPAKPKLEKSLETQHIQLGTFESNRASLLIFSYQELEQATDNFDATRELGDGGFASVYLGKLWDGQIVAVKKLFHDNSRRLQQFSNEIEILSSLNHPNLVPLIGYCQDRSELLLVYEYVSNGTLADHLHGETKGKSLEWETRLNIALGTAQALAYLHFSTNPPILHRDVKSSNILLDHNFKAKVADFGLSRLMPVEASHISTGPQGTPGYVDPDYHHCYRLTHKSDVYSFGVVLAELISAKKAVDLTRDKRDIGLADLVVSKIQSGALHELVDPKLEINVKPLVRDMVWRMAELAFRCLAAEKDDRPNMMEVTDQLQEIKRLGYGGFTQKNLSSYNSSNSALETKKLLSHMYTGSPTSVQDKWRSTSTTPDSSE
ncbi:hypothetical protein SUGI_0014630 [Cryptomeria japonica]|uniref:LEAF RUST 10 DISEASE-RESISTANCE LOCUS RECEPTOR-LIKE PROTEIN KINASE-like 1.2 n=1 Tax=Cryptomeria japonica TaxID=3369 RepID=UPI002408973E|nr:LEAF RUST 10 DISEASE-RESISTANCE LOCUS RECEPTOR-LIKE PROTEIN KINASE-like 1.2 [Cryptomeria japonica]GLJ05253.1 hypothetical protein SUGI_0014630 [Cryptomeria japonica]